MFHFHPHSGSLDIIVDSNYFDASNVEEFRRSFEDNCPGDLQAVTVDLEKVEMIDSSAIGALLGIHKRLTSDPPMVALRNARPTVLSVIELLRLHRVFRLEMPHAAA